MLQCRSSTSYLGAKWIPGHTLPAIIAHKRRIPNMLGLSHMSWLHPKRGLFRPRRHYWTTITLPGFQFFDFAFLGCGVSGILVAPALVWATHSHSQAAMASMHALGRLASTPSRWRKYFRRFEEGGSVANRAKKPRKIRSQDEGAKTRAMAVESHRVFPS